MFDQEDKVFNSHYIWDERNKQIQHVHTFDVNGSFCSFGLVHSVKRGELYLLGGFTAGQPEGLNRTDTIYKYTIAKQKWIKLENVRLPYSR